MLRIPNTGFGVQVLQREIRRGVHQVPGGARQDRAHAEQHMGVCWRGGGRVRQDHEPHHERDGAAGRGAVGRAEGAERDAEGDCGEAGEGVQGVGGEDDGEESGADGPETQLDQGDGERAECY